jgi:hypothetical protein
VQSVLDDMKAYPPKVPSTIPWEDVQRAARRRKASVEDLPPAEERAAVVDEKKTKGSRTKFHKKPSPDQSERTLSLTCLQLHLPPSWICLLSSQRSGRISSASR